MSETHSPKTTQEDRLAGDMDKREFIDRLIRVDHAGEFGAQRIYKGQIDVLGNTDVGPTLRHMAEQEEEHLEAFEQLIRERRGRPTALYPVWNVLGYALGAGTALMGKKAAMACTIAVEECIDEHYQKQLEKLGDDEEELKAKIRKFREDELEHRDIGVDHQGEQAIGYPVMRKAIRAGSKFAIWLSERV
ncbi:MAG: demethoxyubiquinone hydroxylase family protein [Alphaproteobacteria bacterium]|nr:demethoxyubiquinone hydroxylase family protein [Alphaproteobacteria bacterium]